MSTTTLADSARRDLAGFGGELIGPSDANYDAARAVYNAMIDRSPSLIARCASTADVVRAVGFARDRGALLAVRGGGHNGGGLGTCDDGVVVDLAPMKHVEIDEARRTVRVGGGATWADVDSRTGPLGLATPSGIIATTGVGGLTLGGGIGYISRRYGLTIDSLLAAEVVLPDGSTVRASRGRERRPALGAARRRRQLRHRDRVRVPAAPGAERLRGPDVLGARRHARGAALVPRVPARAAARGERLVRDADRAAGAAVPRGTPHAQGLRRDVDGAGHAGGGRAPSRAGARGRHAAPARRRPDALGRSAGPVRAALPAGAAVVLARRLPARGARRRDRRALPLRGAAPDAVLDDAHVPHRRCRPRRRTRRQRVPVPGRELGRGDRRRRPRSGRCGRDPQVDGRLLGRHAPVLRGRRLRQLHDGGGPGARARHVRRQLPPADARQGQVRRRPTCCA